MIIEKQKIFNILKEYHEGGDHYLYICNVEQVYGDETEEALFAWNGYSQLRPAK